MYDVKERQREILKILARIKRFSDNDQLEGLTILAVQRRDEGRQIKRYFFGGEINIYEWMGMLDSMKIDLYDFVDE